MADIWIKTGPSTWTQAKKVHVKTGSTTWRDCKYVYVKTGTSTWKLVFRRAYEFTPTISTPTSNYNLYSKLTTDGWNGTDDVEVTITNNAVIYSTSVGTPAFDARYPGPLGGGGFPADSIITVINGPTGYIIGKGGAGGNGGGATVSPTPGFGDGDTYTDGGDGGNAGYAFAAASTIYIPSGTARIYGGGGGGGGGGTKAGISYYSSKYGYAVARAVGGGSGGGAGGGYSSTSGGTKGPVTALNGYTIDGGVGGGAYAEIADVKSGPSIDGNAATHAAGGQANGTQHPSAVPAAKSPYYGPLQVTVTGGYGGAGGSRGAVGANGSAGGTGSLDLTVYPEPYGAADQTNSSAGGGGTGRPAFYPAPTSPYFVGPGL